LSQRIRSGNDKKPAPVAEEPPTRRRRRERGEHTRKRSREQNVEQSSAVGDVPRPPNSATNGATDPELDNELLTDFWQEFKERR
jgi:hypothetical protein